MQLLEVSQRTTRLVTGAVVVVAVILPSLNIFLILEMRYGGFGLAIRAIVAVALYLPLHIRHVWSAAHARRPRGGRWTLTAMAVVVLGGLPLIGSSWTLELAWLAVSAMTVLVRRWAYLAVGLLVAATIPVAEIVGDPNDVGVWYACAVACRAALLFALVWLAATLRRLRAAQLALTEEAVVRERLRIDTDLRRTLGIALERIALRGQRAATHHGSAERLRLDLDRTIAESRETLAQARRMVRGYRQVSLREELESASALLVAAGIQTRINVSAEDLPDRLDEGMRGALHAELSAALGTETPPSTCLIMVTCPNGRAQVELKSSP
jgi:signal transduction histidine kinase